MSPNNQRRVERLALNRRLEVLDIESGVDFRAEGLDISEHGLSFHAPLEPAVGAQVYVTPGDEDGGRQEFQVVRVQPTTGGYLVGAVMTPRDF